MFRKATTERTTEEDFPGTQATDSSRARLALREEVFEQIHHLERFTPVAFTILSDEPAPTKAAESRPPHTKAG